MLIDVGVNLTNDRFRKDTAEVVDRALAAGVGRIIVTGTNLDVSHRAHALALTRPGVLFSTAGVHPHDARNAPPDFTDRLRTLAANPEVVAIGECGLDHNRDFSPRPVQAAVFDAQVALATELALPLFLHQRDAHAPFLEILDAHDHPPAVVHCFTGTRAELDDYLTRDLYIGITGWVCDDRRGLPLHPLLPRIPANRLLLETDAPYLTPRDLRPKPKRGRNEPQYLPHIAQTVATLRNESVENLTNQSTQNATRLFNLP